MLEAGLLIARARGFGRALLACAIVAEATGAFYANSAKEQVTRDVSKEP